MSKIRSISVLTYAVVCYIIFSSIVLLAQFQAGINCSNLTNVCPNRPVVITCRAPLPAQWKSLNCMPKLFKDFLLNNRNSIKGSRVDRNGFVVTVIDIKNNFVLTSLEFFPNCSYERRCKIRCKYRNSNPNLSEKKNCIIHYKYISKCAC